jgi:hypothetical protein
MRDMLSDKVVVLFSHCSRHSHSHSHSHTSGQERIARTRLVGLLAQRLVAANLQCTPSTCLPTGIDLEIAC